MQSQSEIQVGSVVRLKSSSPKLTVQSKVDEQNFECVWFDNATRMAGVFNRNALVLTTAVKAT